MSLKPVVSAVTISFASLLSLITLTSADTMSTPTYSSSTLSIFNASEYNGSISTIDCGAVENCIIYCHNSDDVSYHPEAICGSIDVNASLVSNLAVECMGGFACYRAEVLSPGPSNQFNMTCDGVSACGRFALDLINTSHVNIDCTPTVTVDSDESPCYSAGWSISNALSTQIHCGYAESLVEHGSRIKDQQDRIAVEHPEPFTYELFEKMAPFLMTESLSDD